MKTFFLEVILKKALDRLKKFYEDGALVQLQSKAHHRQEPGAAAPPPPQGSTSGALRAVAPGILFCHGVGRFDDYEQNKHSGGVLSMIQEIIDESKTMENDAIRAENDSQAASAQARKSGRMRPKGNGRPRVEGGGRTREWTGKVRVLHEELERVHQGVDAGGTGQEREESDR